MRPRVSILWRILIPQLAIQAAAILIIALTTAILAANRTEREIVGRLNDVIEALGNTNFPLTSSVLAKMRGLSGAHFLVIESLGKMETTLEDLRRQPLPFQPSSLPTATRIQSLSQSSTMEIQQVLYFVVSVRSSPSQNAVLLAFYPVTHWRQARFEAALPPLLLGLGSLAMMAIVTSCIAHRISSRIRRIERQVALIAQGDFQEFPTGSTRDEIEDLRQSINRTSRQLQAMSQTIRQSERARLLAQFGAGMAHQLRNAIAGAKMSVQLHARRCPATSENVRTDQSLEVALRQLALMEEQVKGLLAFGKVETSSYHQPFESCNISLLFQEIEALVQPTCHHCKTNLEIPPGSWPNVLGNRSGLRSALLNLTLNAIEAAGPQGQVRISASEVTNQEGRRIVIEVRDNGHGPPVELANQLFEPFITSKREGVGLGLALARQIAIEHDGDLIWLRDDNHTVFRLSLPIVHEANT